MKVVEYLLRTLEGMGVRHIFGNPGTTELPLVRAAGHRERIRYVVALSEVSAVPMADGFARASRSLGVVNLHVAPGLGNGMGGLYTASIAQSPLLVLVGAQDTRFTHTQPILHGPLREMAAPVTKAVIELTSAHNAAFNVRRAIRLALTPPTGPVALLCPPDILETDIADEPQRIEPPALAGLAPDDVARCADLLAGARSVGIIVTEDVHWAGAGAAVDTLAASLDAPVYTVPYAGIIPVATTSRFNAGSLSPNRKGIATRLAGHDCLLTLGGRGFRTTLFAEADFPQVKIWLGADPQVLAADGEFAFARLCDLGAAVPAIAREIGVRRKPPSASRWSGRAPVDLPPPADALHPSRAIHALLRAFRGAFWVDESGLSVSDMRQWIEAGPGEYVTNGSGGIGWGLPAAAGIAIGHPDRQVVAVIGDGSALYASEALWSAAHHGARLLLVVLSNRRYATLNEAASRLVGTDDVELFRLEPPALDFGGLARLYGYRHHRVEREADLTTLLDTWAGRVDACTLLELVIEPALKPVTAARHF